MKWRLSRRAQADVDDIWRWIAPHSRQRADNYLRRLADVFRMLSAHSIGRVREDLGEGLKSFPFRRHIVFFRREAREVVIVRVLHSARDIRPDLFEDI